MYRRCHHLTSAACLAVGIVWCGVAGCGAIGSDRTVLKSLFASECAGSADLNPAEVDLVILDWTGGVSPIYPGWTLEGIDLWAIPTADGGTLGDDAEAFQEDVRRQVALIYCDLGTMPVRVINAEDGDFDLDTSIVHITQELPPNGGTDVGEGEYDPCNEQRDNAAILFGERLLTLSDAYTYDEWVNVFANICAHEIGHALGFGHIARADRPAEGRALYVELMLGGHTMAELRRSQRFLVDQSNCPDVEAQAGKRIDAAAVSCGPGDDKPDN